MELRMLKLTNFYKSDIFNLHAFPVFKCFFFIWSENRIITVESNSVLKFRYLNFGQQSKT